MNQIVIDFSTNLITATVEDETGLSSVISAITPNNYLATLDFFKHNSYTLLDDLVDEVDYSAAEY